MLKQTLIKGVMPLNRIIFGRREVPKSLLSNPLNAMLPEHYIHRPDVAGSLEYFLILPDY